MAFLAAAVLLAWAAPAGGLSLFSRGEPKAANLGALRVPEHSEPALEVSESINEASGRVAEGMGRTLLDTSEPDMEFSMRHDNDLPEGNISFSHSPYRRYKRGPARSWGVSMGGTYDIPVEFHPLSPALMNPDLYDASFRGFGSFSHIFAYVDCTGCFCCGSFRCSLLSISPLAMLPPFYFR